MNRTIEFCCGSKRCPVVTETTDNHIVLGGDQEGKTTWGRDQFADFVEAAKSGKFDELLTEK